jgi:hypothetical protein
MKKNDTYKIIRRGTKTIVIAEDPDGDLARKMVNRMECFAHTERAKQTLRECPLPDHIVQPYPEQMRTDEEKKQRRIANVYASLQP